MELDGKAVTVAELMPLALTNLGHFTSMRVEADKTVRGFGLHMKRLDEDCRLTFGDALDVDRVRAYVRQAVQHVNGPLSLRITIYDPLLTLGNVGQQTKPRVLVTSTPAPAAMVTAPLRVKSFCFTRDAPEVKHTGLWSQLHRRREAKRDGLDDALFVEPDRSISEGATWTAGFIDADAQVVWPEGPTLRSTTAQLLSSAYPTRSAVVTLDDLPNMLGAFATNVSGAVRPVSQIDSHIFTTDHPVFSALCAAYESIRGEVI